MTASLRRLGSLALLLLLTATIHAQSLTISTLAGSRTGGGWVDGADLDARFSDPTGVAIEPGGTIVVADTGNHTIRRITFPDGVTTTLAGAAGAPGFADGPVANARFRHPRGVAVDSAGIIYVADTYNHVIRRIANGVVTTVAGLPGTAGTADGTGAAARFTFPFGLDVDPLTGDIIVADTDNHTIRRVTAAGVVTTIAGFARFEGSDDGFGQDAEFYYPFDVAVDANGVIYVADTYNNTIRRITTDGRVVTVAGKASEDVQDDEPNSASTEDGIGSAARFREPWSIDVDATGTLWVTDTWNHTIRRVSPSFEVTTVAGRAEVPGRSNANGANARFYAPSGIAVAQDGFFIVDRFNQAVRFMFANFDVPTLAGSIPEWGVANGPSAAARFFYPTGAAVDPAGNVYISEVSDTIRKITPAGVVSTLAGSTDQEGSADGTGSAARFDAPQGLAADAQGNVYVADSFNCTIRKITPAGVVTTIAGTVGVADFRNGVGTQARFDEPQDVAVDSLGNVYVADTFNHVIRIIEPSGLVSTFASGFSYPTGVAVDAERNVYVADRGNNLIRKITPAGVVTTVAGSGQAGHVDGKGTAARFEDPAWIASTPDGTLYVTEWDQHSIRRIDRDGNVTTCAGVASFVTAGNVDGTGAGARFFYPHGVAAGIDGRVYIADQYNHNVRVGTLAAPQVTSFTATPPSIEEGGSTTLAWTTTDATTVTISGVGTVASSGTQVVTPTVTTTYTLTAIGPAGTATATVTVLVGEPGRRRSVRH